jgi:hypothetical protein
MKASLFVPVFLCAASTGHAPARASEAVTYSYDVFGRVAKISSSGTVNNGITSVYCYDAADNRSRSYELRRSYGGVAELRS